MKCHHEFTPGRLEFVFERDEDDELLIESRRYSMTDTKIFFDLPREILTIHPDILGLATILLSNPFVGKFLKLPLPVSRAFFEMASGVISRYKIVEEVDENLAPLNYREFGLPGLSFSGGADSSAALAIMPARTVPIFLNRPMEPDSHYDSHAPLEICNMLAKSGYEVQIVNSNLEYIRNPVGFPTDLANAIPALLLSEHLELDCIAFGTVLESGYGIGHEHFTDYGRGSHWAFFGTMFRAVGVHLCLPTLGISEVGTTIIGNTSPIASIGQSCIRGSWKRPCNKCWKCFRKELLAFSLNQEFSDTPHFWRMLKINEIQIRLSAFPISHENVVTYSLQRIDLDEFPSLKPIAAKLNMTLNLSFLEKWFPESIEFVPDKYRNFIRSKILEFIEPTTFGEEGRIKSWNMDPHLASTRAIMGQDSLISYWQDIN